MLLALCGNKSVAKILLFLFVNGSCYGAQLHRAFKAPLTPIQKGLDRLEKGGLIISYYQGKTRLYQFNPAYPLVEELEAFLKKAYTLLPAHEKKEYYVVKQDRLVESKKEASHADILLDFWERLLGVKELMFKATTKSKEQKKENRQGNGIVVAEKRGDKELIFHEKGSWKGGHQEEVSFTNIFRWTLDLDAGVISLEHLRRGPEHPVFLFHLAPSGKYSLLSVDSHLCLGDTYFAQIRFPSLGFQLHWRVIGPKKNEEIDYYYA